MPWKFGSFQRKPNFPTGLIFLKFKILSIITICI